MPYNNIRVKFSPRAGQVHGTQWRVLISDSDKTISISVEDL